MPPRKWRLARLLSIHICRSRNQSSISSISLPCTVSSLSKVPRELSAVAGESALAVASLEAGEMMRAMMAASARSR